MRLTDNQYYKELKLNEPDPKNPYYKAIQVKQPPQPNNIQSPAEQLGWDKGMPPKQQTEEPKQQGQSQTQQFIIPDKYNLEITGQTSEEIRKKVYSLKNTFPALELSEDAQGNLRLTVPKGNKELHQKVYRYLNNIPEADSSVNAPEFKTELVNVETTPKQETGLADIISTLADASFSKDPTEKATGFQQAISMIGDRYKDAFPISKSPLDVPTDLYNRVNSSLKDLQQQAVKSSNDLLTGLTQNNLTQFSNGVLGLSMMPINIPIELANTLPGGKVVTDIAMLEPNIIGETTGKILDKVAPNLSPNKKELITNVSTLLALWGKGKLMHGDFKGTDIKPEIEKYYKTEVEPLINPLGDIESKIKDVTDKIANAKTETESTQYETELANLNKQKEDFTTALKIPLQTKPEDIPLLSEPQNKMYVDEKGNVINQSQFDETKKGNEIITEANAQIKESILKLQADQRISEIRAKSEAAKVDKIKELENIILDDSKTPDEKLKAKFEIAKLNKPEETPKAPEEVKTPEVKQEIKPPMTEAQINDSIDFHNKTKNEQTKEIIRQDLDKEGIKYNLDENGKMILGEKPIETTPPETPINSEVPQEIKKETDSNAPHISEIPREQMPEKVSEKVKSKAEEKLAQMEGAEIIRQGGFGKDLGYEQGTHLGEIKQPSFTINTFPQWFSDLGKSKQTIINALKKIIEDKGKDVDKGNSTVIADLKNTILNELTYGGVERNKNMISGKRLGNKQSRTWKTPNDIEISDFLKQVEDSKQTPQELQKAFDEWEKKNIEKENAYYQEQANNQKQYENRLISEQSYKQAQDNIKNGNFNKLSSSDILPKHLKDLSTIGLYHFENGLRNFAEWGKKMIKEVGDWVKPHLRKLWAEISNPNNIKDKFPDLITQGISLGKKAEPKLSQAEFNKKLFEEKGIIPFNERQKAYEEYLKEVPEKINISNEPRPIKVIRDIKEQKSGFNWKQKIIFETLNRFEPFSRYAKQENVRYTRQDPTTYAFNLLNKQSIASEWIKGETTPILQKDGNYTFEKGTVKDYLKDIQGKEKDFEEYLIARRVLEDRKQYDKMKSELDNMQDGKAKNELSEKLLNKQKQIKTDNFDINDAQRIVSERGKTFSETIKKYDNINNKLLTFAENSGLISKEKADLYKRQEGYASFRRDLSETGDIGSYSSDPSTKLNAMKERTGSRDLDIISPIYSQVNAIQETISKGLENELWNKVYDLSKKNKDLAEHFKITNERANLKFKRDGKEIFINATEDIMKVAKTLRGNERETFSRFLSLPKDIFTRLTTSANPFFTLVNIPRDQLTALFTTKTGMIPVVDPVKSLIDLIKKTSLSKEYKALGGEKQTFASYMDLPPEKMQREMLMDLPKNIRPKETALEKGTNIVNSGLHILEFPSNISEIMTRFSEFKKAKEKGLSDVEAMYYASEITIPFQQQGNLGGNMGREAIKSIAYFNANLQGLYKSLRSIKEQPKRFAVVTAGLLTTALTSSMYTMNNGSDEQKRLLANQPARELGRAIFFPSPDGKTLIRIPVPEMIGGITGLTQLFVINSYSENKVKFKDYLDALSQTVPNQLDITDPKQAITSWIPQVMKPTLEATFNTKSYPEVAPIVPDYMKNFAKDEQYTDYTSKVAKFIGKITDSSPMIVEHWIKNQFGSVGNLLMGIGDYAEGDISRVKSRIGLMRQEEGFIMSGRAYNNFYDQKLATEQEWNKIKNDKGVGDNLKKEVLKRYDLNNDINEALSTLRQVLKVDKNLPEDIKQKTYELILKINNNTNIGKQEYEPLLKQISELGKKEKIKTKGEKQKEGTKRNKNLRN